MRALGNGLLGHRMSIGLADGVGDFVPLQSQRMLQHHLDGGSYVEKKMVRSPNK